MDMSKLPKLSQTQTSATPAVPTETTLATTQTTAPIDPQTLQPDARAATYSPQERPSPGEVWFNIIVGVIFLLMGRSFGGYMLSKVTHQPYHTGFNWTEGPKTGQEVAYTELQGNVFWNDSAMFLFGMAVVADALIRMAIFSRFRQKIPLAYLAFAITTSATIYNIYVSGRLFKENVLPLLSLLAVAFGGYIAYQQWMLLKTLLRTRAE